MKIRFAALMFTTVFVLCGASAFGQSTNRDMPTPIGDTTTFRGSVRDTNSTGSTAYYYSLNVEPGTIHSTLTFTPPSGGASMSVVFSGPDCCDGASLGGDGGDTNPVTSETTFRVTRSQTLLLEVYVDAGAGGTVTFTLQFEGSVGGAGGTTFCTDLSMTLVTYKVEQIGTKEVKVTITGILANESTADFVSGDGQQKMRLQEKPERLVAYTTVRDQPFTNVRARGRLAFAATKTYRTGDFLTLRPSYKLSIVYDSAIGADGNVRNDDCVPANNVVNLAYRRPG
ncbi:MAG: hypothetical protein WA584_04230 [Pyrinomonadaceae bacterium]